MGISRFQVMAVLQAARAYVLGYPLSSAKSFGLNRAIFYAAAKKGFKVQRPQKELLRKRTKLPEEKIEEIEKSFGIERIGDEMAYCVTIGGIKYFTIGGEIQDEEKFEKQVAKRFKNFEKVWEEAINICKNVDKGILLSQRYFYEAVYKPRRDYLVQKWSNM
ncbi:MAG: hypothetical protein ABIN23_05905 [candidate division WOR-3 bacterium]|nr:hypothetical protein [Candidatus Omnitrophota bacterium]MCM8807525.1 hypothetical protein [Candidatus Omnitrophota bacterium]